MSAAEGSGSGRVVVKEVTVQAPPERVWEALTEPEELMRWFPPLARVEPGEGGTITLSWGEGMEGTAPIHLWEPPHRFGWVEQHPGEPPVRIAVEFQVEAAAGGSSTVRLVQSGFGPDANWDDYISSVDGGWTFFMANLRHYLEHHRDVPRTMISDRSAPRRPRDEAWDRLLGAVMAVARKDASDAGPAPGTEGGVQEGEACSLALPDFPQLTGSAFLVRRPGHFGCTIAELEDAILLVELEPGGEKWKCGFWLSLYGVDEATEARVRRAVAGLVAEAWGRDGRAWATPSADASCLGRARDGRRVRALWRRCAIRHGQRHRERARSAGHA